MPLTIVEESPATWTPEKRDILRPFRRAFNLGDLDFDGDTHAGVPLIGHWFRVTNQATGELEGFAWLVPFGDGGAEIEIAIRQPGAGAGTEVLEMVEDEARKKGIGRLEATVRPQNERAADVTRWLETNGFAWAPTNGCFEKVL